MPAESRGCERRRSPPPSRPGRTGDLFRRRPSTNVRPRSARPPSGQRQLDAECLRRETASASQPTSRRRPCRSSRRWAALWRRLGETPGLRSATRMATGSVAELDEVEKPTTMTGGADDSPALVPTCLHCHPLPGCRPRASHPSPAAARRRRRGTAARRRPARRRAAHGRSGCCRGRPPERSRSSCPGSCRR